MHLKNSEISKSRENQKIRFSIFFRLRAAFCRFVVCASRSSLSSCDCTGFHHLRPCDHSITQHQARHVRTEGTQRAHKGRNRQILLNFVIFWKNLIFDFFYGFWNILGLLLKPKTPHQRFLHQSLSIFVDSRPDSCQFSHFSQNVDLFDNQF